MEKNKHRQEICALLNISELEYNTHQFNEGYAYLFVFFGGNEAMANAWSGTSCYWKWWVNQWDIRNARMLEEFAPKTRNNPNLRLWFEREYYASHQHMQLDVYPGSTVSGLIDRELKNQLKIVEFKKVANG